MTKSITAAIYARVSTADKQDYNRQINELTKIIKEHGYKNIEVFAESISGYDKKERFQLLSLLDKIEKDNTYFGCIYTSEISRISRDPTETRRIVDHLTDLGVPIYIQSLNQTTIDSNGQRNMIMNIILQVLMEYSNFEAEVFKIRSKSGLRISASQGKAGGSSNFPYGYYKDENKMLSINKEEAIIIKRIFNYSLSGLGTKKIANILNSEKIPTRYNKVYTKPIKYNDGRLAKPISSIIWVDGVIYNILKNSIYKGERKFKDEIFPAPIIIDKNTWNSVQEILSEKFNKKTKTTRYLYLLKDILKCGVCGRNYYGRYKADGRDKFYMCSSRRIKNGNCGNKGISIEIVESAIWSFLKFDKFFKVAFINSENDNETTISELKSLNKELEFENSEIAKKYKERERIIGFGLKGIIPESKVILELKVLERQVSTCLQKINFIEKNIQNKNKRIEITNNYGNIQKDIINLSKDRNRVAEIISKLIEKVIINYHKEEYYFFTIYFLNTDLPVTMLFDKKKMEYSIDTSLGSLKYNKNILQINEPFFQSTYFFYSLFRQNEIDKKYIETISFDANDFPSTTELL